MPRYVIGVTLTPEERSLMKLPHRATTTQQLSRVSSHEMNVALPDGTSCKVTYRRFGAYSHRFLFAAPLEEAVWFPEALINTTAIVEQKAEELTSKAFSQAMMEEQRLMRCKTVPKGSSLPPGEPQMKAKTAELCAGCYAVCSRSSCGKVSAIGSAFSTSEQPIAELHDGAFAHVQLFGSQRLVIGICCRYLRRWVEPRLLPFQRDVPAVSEVENTDIE